MTIIYVMAAVIGVVIGMALVFDAKNKAQLRQARQRGLYPPAGQGTDQDVERLVDQGHKIMAIKLYREIHDVGLKTAKEEVDRIVKQSWLKGHHRF